MAKGSRKGQGDKAAPALALKQQQPVVPGGAGGLRSPMLGAGGGAGEGDEPIGGESAPASGGAARPSGAAKASGGASGKAGFGDDVPPGGGGREVSGIDMSVVLTAGNATNLSHVMYDRGQGRRRIGLRILAGLVVLGAAAFCVMNPKVVMRAVDGVIGAKDHVLDTVRPSRKPKEKRPRAKGVYTGAAARREPEPLAEAPQLPRGDCRAAMKFAAGRASIAVPDRVALAECYLLADDPRGAEEALEPLKEKIMRTSDAELNMAGSDLTLADAMHTLVLTQLRQGKPREADELLRNKCLRWAQTNTCVAKVMVIADRKLGGGGGSGVGAMFAARGRLEGKAQARLWLAGAQIATVEGKIATADQRYGMALAAAPRKAVALRKLIYETEAVELYHRGQLGRLKRLVGTAMGEFRGLEASAKTKLRLLGELTGAEDKARAVRGFLTREDVTFRARGDFDYVEILGPESLRYGLEVDFVRLLKRASDQYERRYRASNQVVKKIAVWEIRATLSRKDYDGVIGLVGRYRAGYGPDAFAHHMRGLAYMSQSSHPKYQILAAQEFQAALRAKMNWESLCALGMAWTRANKAEQVPPVIKDLERMITTRGQRYWIEMLKAEWYMAKEKYSNAQTILDGWAKDEPGFATPQRLLLQLHTKVGRKADAERAQSELDELARAPKGAASREAFASPVGVMALGRRPIE